MPIGWTLGEERTVSDHRGEFKAQQRDPLHAPFCVEHHVPHLHKAHRRGESTWVTSEEASVRRVDVRSQIAPWDRNDIHAQLGFVGDAYEVPCVVYRPSLDLLELLAQMLVQVVSGGDADDAVYGRVEHLPRLSLFDAEEDVPAIGIRHRADRVAYGLGVPTFLVPRSVQHFLVVETTRPFLVQVDDTHHRLVGPLFK